MNRSGATTILMRAIPLLAAALLAASVISCNKSSQPEQEAAESPASVSDEANRVIALSDEEIRKAGIHIDTVQPRAMSEAVALTGTLTTNQNRMAKIVPRLSGRIASVNVDLGARVKAGQVLAVLQSIELGEARSVYQQSLSEDALAESALARAEKLVGENIVSQKDYLRTKADAQRARAGLRAARDKLRLLGVSASAAATQQADAAYPLTSPFAGTIIEKNAVRGELAEPDRVLFTVADLTTVWLEADVYEKDLAKLAIGASAKITVAAYPGATFTGRLTYLSAVMDPSTRTVKARVVLPNKNGRLRPGMFADAVLQSTNAVPAIALPSDAVLLVENKPTVFVAEPNGFAPRTVVTGSVANGLTRIKDGLTPGEKVVVAGAYALKARMLKSEIGDSD